MADQTFPWRKTFILGFGFFGISIISPLFNSLIPPMLEDLGLAATVIGFIMTWDNIINLFSQPWVGSRSDRTHSRFGRRKPWLMLGAPLAAFFFILLPFVRETSSSLRWQSWALTSAWRSSGRPLSLTWAICSGPQSAARPMA